VGCKSCFSSVVGLPLVFIFVLRSMRTGFHAPVFCHQGLHFSCACKVFHPLYKECRQECSQAAILVLTSAADRVSLFGSHRIFQPPDLPPFWIHEQGVGFMSFVQQLVPA
jgi:hypothetical protein